MGKLDKAQEEFIKALEIDPEYADAHYNLGLLFHRQGELDEAVNHYKKAILHGGNNPRPHNNLGVAYATMGKTREAEEEYQKALKIDPSFDDARVNLERLKGGD